MVRIVIEIDGETAQTTVTRTDGATTPAFMEPAAAGTDAGAAPEAESAPGVAGFGVTAAGGVTDAGPAPSE